MYGIRRILQLHKSIRVWKLYDIELLERRTHGNSSPKCTGQASILEPLVCSLSTVHVLCAGRPSKPQKTQYSHNGYKPENHTSDLQRTALQLKVNGLIMELPCFFSISRRG
jgi:hypothetical protein